MGKAMTWRLGAVTALALIVATPAMAQRLPNCSVRGRADFNESASVTQARQAMTRADADALAGTISSAIPAYQQAAASCAEVVRATRSRHVEAQMCVGEASLKLADLGAISPTTNYYETARCAYAAASSLVGGGNARQAAAQEGLGRSLQGLGRLGGANAGARFNEAITALTAATNFNDPEARPGRYFALARALRDAGRANDANRAFTSGNGLRPDPTALIEQSRLQALMTPAGTQAAALLQQAGSLGSAEAYVEQGKILLPTNRDAARTAFDNATRARITNGSTPGINYQWEGFYFLSVVDALRPAPDWTAVLAEINGRGAAQPMAQPHYRRQLCLATIGLGGVTTFRTQAADLGACGVDANAEGYLLRGMYYLRRAQYVENIGLAGNRQRWAEYLLSAEQAFNTGLGLVAQTPIEGRRLPWPGEAPPPGQAQGVGPDVRQLLEGGATLVRLTRDSFFNGSCRNGPPNWPSTPSEAAARPIFERYKVFSCLPT